MAKEKGNELADGIEFKLEGKSKKRIGKTKKKKKKRNVRELDSDDDEFDY